MFHGAKFYAELAPADVSTDFLDAVAAQFDASPTPARARDRAPDYAGLARPSNASRRRTTSATSTSSSPASVRPPGVLLRRVPWRVLVRAGAPAADLAHVRLLAAQRGVPVEEVPELPYSCVGLIHPRFTRGATGADGRAVRAG